VICIEGEPGPRVLAFFVIVEGSATVTAGGRVKATLGPGDHFGEMALLYDVPRQATVTADTELECLAISAWEFRPFVEAHPRVAWKMLEELAKRRARAAAGGQSFEFSAAVHDVEAAPATVDSIEALGRVPLLAAVERAELERLAGKCRERTFQRGAVVTREGEKGATLPAFFIIVEGAAAVTVGGEARARLGPGDHFGEISLLYDVPRSATVTAESDLRCLTIGAEELRSFVEKHPAVAWAMLETLAQRLGEDLGLAGRE
jgi:CRP-like cAMP-binding protein